ncbi:MAG: hypothetical protein ACO3FX_11555 [Gemmobacter sp.]
MRAGWFLYVTSRAGANALLGAGQMVLWPVHLARPVTGRPGFVATYPSGTARAAIYADADGRPGARVWQGDAALAVSAAGHYFHANPVTLEQGVWWVGVAAVSANLWYAFARETGATVARPALVNLEFAPAAPVFTAPAGAPPEDLGQTDHSGATLAPVFVFAL